MLLSNDGANPDSLCEYNHATAAYIRVVIADRMQAKIQDPR